MNISQDYSKTKTTPSLYLVGDCILSPYFDHPPIEPVLCNQIEEANISIANLEAPVNSGYQTPKWGPTHTQRDGALLDLRQAGFDVVTLANNHIMDLGTDGLAATLEACADAGLETVGAGEDITYAVEPLYQSIDGTDIAIINASQKWFGVADDHHPGVAWIKHPGFEKRIREIATQADITVLVTHGGIEYVPIPPHRWQRTLRSLVEKGVDVVVGHHPHVAQAWEVYEGAPIFYSLGNFAFWIENRPATEWAYTIELSIDSTENKIGGASVRLVETRDGRVQPMRQRNPEAHWNFLIRQSNVIEAAASEPGYWQAVASRLFEERYKERFSDYGTGHLLSLLRHPLREGSRLTRGVFSKSEMRDEKDLTILDLIQNDSHQDVVETALAVKTGAAQDRRTPKIRQELTELETWVNQQPDRSQLETALQYGRKAIRRLSPL